MAGMGDVICEVTASAAGEKAETGAACAAVAAAGDAAATAAAAAVG